MIKVALLECKSGAIATNDACLAPLFIAHFFPQPYNQLHINVLSLHAQNSRISHKRFCCAPNEEYWALEMQILSGKLTDKQEFICESICCIRQGFNKNLYPHAFCCHTLRVHDTVWRMGFTRALLSTPILQTISWVMPKHHCANKRKNIKNTR